MSSLVRAWILDRAFSFDIQPLSLVGNTWATVMFVRSVIQVDLCRPRDLLLPYNYLELSCDDTTLYSQFDNAAIANHYIELEINNELSNINDWLTINKLSLNIKQM